MKTFNLQIVFVASVLLICSQVMASNNFIERNSFVVDCSRTTGEIVNVRFDNENIWSSVVIEDAEFFECVPEGYFIYRNKGGDWLTGNIKSAETISKINPSVIPQNVIYAAICHDGQRIAWLTRDRMESRLFLTELASGKSNILVSKQGFIWLPSWSPDNLHIAYYYAAPEAIKKDAYILMMIRAKHGAKEEQLTPPSLWMSLSSIRSISPQWSPDGSMVLFEGLYDKQKPMTFHSIVNVESKNIRKCKYGTWSQDSKRLFTSHKTDNSVVEHQYRLGSVVIFSKEMKVDVWQTSLPKDKDCFIGSWADDGRHIVFATFDDSCYLMETKTGRQRRFFQSEGSCKFYWLSETPVSANYLQGWSLFVIIGLVVLVIGLLIIRFVKRGNVLPGRNRGK